MTRYIWGLILASGMVVGQADTANAQFNLTIGNPYLGTGIAIGTPSYGYGYNSYSTYGFGAPGLYGAPVVATPYVGRSFGYSSGYRGYAPAPYYGGYRGGYGYRGYRGGYGGYRGVPFRGFGGFRR